MKTPELRIGLCGIGLAAYWPQFEGLRARLEEQIRRVELRLQTCGASVENLGLVDSAENGRRAGTAFRRADVDLLVIYVAT